MKKLVVVASILVLFSGVAVAQSSGSKAGSSTGGASSSTAGAGSGLGISAPVGHRQPRAADMPDEKNLSDPSDPLNKENKALDRKIKGICRGC